MFPLDRPLWTDEAMLAVNIIERGFAGLLQAPLAFDQNSPAAFLFLERLMVVLLGPTEAVLRVVPLLAGIVAVGLFALLAARLLDDQRAVLLGTLLFAISPYLIYYSVEVKQYALDVLATITVLLVSLRMLQASALSRTLLALLAVTGHAALLVSHSSLFVLAACGTALAGHCAARGQWRHFTILGVIGAAWLAHVAFFYLLLYRHGVANHRLQDYFTSAFMPLNSEIISWLRETIWLLRDPAGFGILPAWVTALAVLAGVVFLWQARGPWITAMIAGPVAFAAAASAARAYPLYGRLFLFAVPLVLLCVCVLAQKAYRWKPALGHLIAAILVTSTAHRLATFTPPVRMDLRAAFATVAAEASPGDQLIVLGDATQQHHLSRGVASYYQLLFELPERGIGFTHLDSARGLPVLAAGTPAWLIYAAPTVGADPADALGARVVHADGRLRAAVRR